MLIGSIFFAAMGLIIESLSDEYSFTWIATIRSATALVVGAGLVIAGGANFAIFRPASLWMRSLAGSGAMLCIFFAMTHYDVAVVLSLTSMYPIWVGILGWPMLGHAPSRETWWAILVSTLGMWLIYGAATGGSVSGAHQNYWPQLAIPLAALASMFSAIALIGLHRVKQLDSRAIVTHFSAISTLLSLMAWFCMPQHQQFTSTNSGSVVRLLAVGLTAVLGQLFLTKAFAAGRPARISVVGLSQVAIAAGYKWVVDGRIPSSLGCLGMVLVIGATAWVMLSTEAAEAEVE